MKKNIYKAPRTGVLYVSAVYALLKDSGYIPFVPGGGGFDVKEEHSWEIDWDSSDDIEESL